MASPAIGIDLGNSLMRVAVFQNDQVEVVANEQGDTAFPSFVTFTSKGRLIGEESKNKLTEELKNTVFDVKCLLGRSVEDPSLLENVKNWPFAIVNGNSNAKIQITYKNQKKSLHPEQILAMIIGKLKDTAEEYLGCTVKDAVVTIPSQFTYSQRQATYAAFSIAGLNVTRFMSESLAAAVSYGIEKKVEKELVLLLDFGNSSTSVSVVKMEDGSYEEISTTGDACFGGKDFDNRMLSFLSYEFQQVHKSDITKDLKAMIELLTECENAKCILSSYNEATINIECLYDEIDFRTCITRACFEELCEDLFSKVMELVEKCITDAKLDKSEISRIVTIGGSSQIPKVQQLLKEYFNSKEIDNPPIYDEAVVHGAAIQAAILCGFESELTQDLIIQSVTPHSLGIETDRDHRSLSFPFHQNPVTSLMSAASDHISETLTAVGTKFAGKSLTNVAAKMANDAMSAAGSIIPDRERIAGRMMTTLIKRNSPIPTRETKLCTTFADNQTATLIHIYEGECLQTKDNNLLGKLELDGIPSAPRGVPQIEVSLDLDANGTLSVVATEKETNRQSKFILHNETGRFSKEEIERMKFDMEKFKIDDKKLKDKVSSKKFLETYCNQVKDTIEGDVFEEDRSKILEACNKNLEWLASNPVAQRNDYEQRRREIADICQPIMSKIYQVVTGSPEELASDFSNSYLKVPTLNVPGSHRKSSISMSGISRWSSNLSLSTRSLSIIHRGSTAFLDSLGDPKPREDIMTKNTLRSFCFSISERCNMIRESCMEAITWMDENPTSSKADVGRRQKEIEHMCKYLIPQFLGFQ